MICSATERFQSDLAGRTVIVGAGAVGITMGIALARAGHPVTILEGGPRVPPGDYTRANQGPLPARPYDSLLTGRMKALGGTTLLWGGQLVPFERRDFDSLDATGERLWPIGYDDVAPWIGAACDLLGVAPEARDTEDIWRRATGRDAALGSRLTVGMNIWLEQPDFTRLFHHELDKLPGLEVVTDCLVTAVSFGDGSAEAYAEVTLPDGSTHAVHPAQVVLANGTIEIAGLLLKATGNGAPFASNAHVGKWYMDHLHGLIGEVAISDRAALSAMFDNVYFEGRKYGVKIRQSAAGKGGVNIVGTLNPAMSPGQLLADLRRLVGRVVSGKGGFVPAAKRGFALARVMPPLAWRYLRHRRSTSLFDRGTKLGVEVEQLPSAESFVVVDPATARAGVHWAIDHGLLDHIARFGADIRDAFARSGLGKVTLNPRLEARDPDFLDRFHGAHHHMGGARMAASAARGVVDADLKVFGTDNLFVAGAAVFPSGSFANSTLTAIALGLRLADHLAGRSPTSGGNENGFMGRLAFGCSRLAGGASAPASRRLLRLALDRGVAAIDCAPSYGMGLAERVAGDVLRSEPAQVEVIAKLGSERDPLGWAKSWPREARRRLHDRGPRSQSAFEPLAAPARYGTGDFSPEALRWSHAVALARLGNIDTLLLHDCGKDEFTPAVAAVLEELAAVTRARPGYANRAVFDAVTDNAFPPDYVAECAIDPRWLTGDGEPPARKALILHSIVATGGWLASTDPAFAEGLEEAARLIPAADMATSRIAALYALASVRVPGARLVFASTYLPRLEALLDTFAALDAVKVAEAFSGARRRSS